MPAMRLLLNENISGSVILALRNAGHDVLAVKESMRGAEDAVVLGRAQVEARIVVTHDKDFGELAFRCRLPSDSGIILLRLSGDDPDVDNRRVLHVLASRADWAGHFTVVTKDRVRMRPLPR